MTQTCNMYQPLKYDSLVEEIQRKLNAIRDKNHISVPDWPHLDVDGLYGKNTKGAVKAFKKYYYLTDRSDALDYNTVVSINERHYELTMLNYCRIYAPTPVRAVNMSIENESSYDYFDLAEDFVSLITGTIENMAEVIKKITDPKLLTNSASVDSFLESFRKITKKVDPELDKLKQGIQSLWKDKELVESLGEDARKQVHTARTNLEVRQIQQAQSVTAKTSRIIKLKEANVRHMQTTLAQRAAEINIINKIKIKFNPNTVVKVAKVIKPIGLGLSAKDIILDITWYSWRMDWGEFCEKFKKDVYQFIDDFIIGALTDAIIGLIAGALGVTTLTGGAIVITVLAAILISSLIGYALDERGFSFSEYFENIIMTTRGWLQDLMNTTTPAPLIA